VPPPVETVAQAPAPAASQPVPPASAPAPAASAPVAAASAATAAASAPAGESASLDRWPSDTRLTYAVTGEYRNPVSGTAHVQWQRDGSRYQVRLDVTIRIVVPITQTLTSQGEVTPTGLIPRAYEEMRTGGKRRVAQLGDQVVVLGNGSSVPRPAGVQDTASQFVQLTYMFSTQPELLRVGNIVAFPLALPRTMDNYAYEIVDDQRVITPFGALAAFHLKPRPRTPKRPNQLSAELWIAPELRYLPVRIRIEQDAANYVDLIISRKPEIASIAEPASGATNVAASSRTPP
jgi:hypothetical protein